MTGSIAHDTIMAPAMGQGTEIADYERVFPRTPETERVIIRPYQDNDRKAIRSICCNTGFFGNPIESIFSDREVFADLFAGPYLDHEPDWALVAEADGRVIGYLLGSVSSCFGLTLMYSGLQTTLKMLRRFAAGDYSAHPRNRRFIRWLLTCGYREQPKHPRGAAHLHLDIEKPYRGRVGPMLWREYENRLRAAGVRGCYGAFFSRPDRQPELAYSRFGFSVFDRRRTTLFEPEVSAPVEIVCVQKSIHL